MANLAFAEKHRLEKLFDMGGGYVLGFSNRTFREFVFDSTGSHSRHSVSSVSKC